MSDKIDKVVHEASYNFRVTDRGLKKCEELAQFDLEDIRRGATVLNNGSGLFQKFEKELKEVRPDVTILSVDPTFILNSYEIERPYDKATIHVTKDDIPYRWRDLANRQGTIAALGQNLPIRSSSVDFALDVHGPAHYAKDWNAYEAYLKEVVRVLKPGAKFHISEVYSGDPTVGDPEELQKKTREAVTFFYRAGFKADVFQQEEMKLRINGEQVPLMTVGAIITKPKTLFDLRLQV